MSLKGIATETLKMFEQGGYTNSTGHFVSLQPALQRAVAGTVLHAPEQAHALLQGAQAGAGQQAPLCRVVHESTQVAAHRMAALEGVTDVVALNFASARNPGGSFINGAKAQEEDVARCSGLYPCLLTQPIYYSANRATESMLYTDHLIYSPGVPWFRTRNRELLDASFEAAIITAPAPNAGQALMRDTGCGAAIEATLRRRAGLVLAVARAHGHRNLLLGAWGCGVFRNDPAMVADAFGAWLEGPEFQGCFDRAEFAVYDSTPDLHVLSAFQARFPDR